MKFALSLLESQWKELMAAWGEPNYRAKQLVEWSFAIDTWEKATNLPNALREKLQKTVLLRTLQELSSQRSRDGDTIKYLFGLHDGLMVESVLIHAPPARNTVCVSSQVGCAKACSFCASGQNGLLRNLDAAEIVEQVLFIQKNTAVTHIVFMGMGEPLDNTENVVQAVRIINKELKISVRNITISTVGDLKGIERLTQEDLGVNLVLSLHAPNQHVRKKIIPSARAHDIDLLVDAIDTYGKKTGRDPSYEYILIDGINDKEEHAQELAELLQGRRGIVNLIPYNPVPNRNLARPPKERIEAFERTLKKAKRLTTRRYTKGADIAAACGQLLLQQSSS